FLNDEGVLFCAKQSSIDRAKYYIGVEFEAEEGKRSGLKKFWGSILFLYYSLLEALTGLWRSQDRFGDPRRRHEATGAEVPIVDIPQSALIEALANFLIHRDYSDNDVARIKIFEDRIEFINPGTSEIDPSKLMSSTEDLNQKYHRNKRIIEAMRFARINQHKGSGIRSIRHALIENGNVLPDGQAAFRVENIVNDTRGERRFRLIM